MFAIAQFKGKQIRVEENKEYAVPYFSCKIGDKITADKVLFVSQEKEISVEEKDLNNAKIEAEVSEIGQNEKVSVVKFHSKKRYQKLGGHRQDYVKVKINKITL